MKIDIIDYTERQLSLLSEEQLQEVQEAQVKKNRLMRALAEKLQDEKRRLINNGLFLSYMWAWTKSYWEKVYEEEIGWVREGLLFYLHYVQGVVDNPPYEMDYSLSVPERKALVQSYYEQTYSNYKERFEAFKQDKAAAQYLGEAYKALWDHFYALSERPL